MVAKGKKGSALQGGRCVAKSRFMRHFKKNSGTDGGAGAAVVGKWEERLLEKKARVEIVSLTLENPTAMAGNREKKVFSRREVRRWGTSSAPFRNDVARYPGSTNI